MDRPLRTRNVFLAMLALGLFALAARNVIDPDVGWHLKTGQYIVEHKSVPHTDPFSYTRGGEPWVAHEWLTDLLLYGLERTAGFGALIIVFAAIISGTFFLLYLRCGRDPFVAGVAALFAAWATMPLWGVRPQVLSLLLTSLWLLILERSDRNPKLLWWTLPLTLLWVNLHAGFALGLALSAMFLAAGLVERRLGYSDQTEPHLRTAAFILLLDFLLVPLNPNGLKLFSYPIETLRSSAMQSYIAEWASPNFHRAEYWPFLLLILGTLAALGWSRLRVRPRALLLLLVSLYAGLCSIRLMPLFILIAVPFFCQAFGTRGEIRPESRGRPRISRSFMNAVIVLGMATFAGVHVTQVIERQPQAERQAFPAGAVAFLQAHPSSGHIFNHYDWGGYLIWKLYPAIPVFIDGRADLYGQPLLGDFADAYQLKAAWRQTLQRWNIEAVIVPEDSALATGLRASPGWTVAYQDAQAVVLTAPAQPLRASPTPPLP
jgi:hypothetical protein